MSLDCRPQDVTPAELRTLHGVAEIAAVHQVAAKTVGHQVSAVLRKLGAANHAHAVALGYQLGLLGEQAATVT